MSNAVRHAKPTVINVSLRCDPPNLVLEITDNGSGIADPQTACIEGFGLSNMQARAEKLIGGEPPMMFRTAKSTLYYPGTKKKATDLLNGSGRVRYFRGGILLNRKGQK